MTIYRYLYGTFSNIPIGVIMPHYNMKGLAETIGVEEDDLSAGEFKKPVSFFRKMTDKEKEYLKKQMLTPTYNNFIASVAENRGVSKEKILPYTEGKIYIGNDESIQGVLVDEVVVLHRLKEKMKKKYSEEVSFVNLAVGPQNKLFGGNVEFNINLNTDLKQSMSLE